jgi:hypothetical protein
MEGMGILPKLCVVQLGSMLRAGVCLGAARLLSFRLSYQAEYPRSMVHISTMLFCQARDLLPKFTDPAECTPLNESLTFFA